MIKVTDTLITYKKLSNKSIVAVIFIITKIKHLQKICDFIKYDELLECELTGTILKFENTLYYKFIKFVFLHSRALILIRPYSKQFTCSLYS